MLALIRTVSWPIANGSASASRIRCGEQAGMIGLLAAGLDDGELVAAEPGDQLVAAHRRPEPLRRRDQQGVAGRVAVNVVDRLEAVEVDAQDRDRLGRIRRPWRRSGRDGRRRPTRLGRPVRASWKARWAIRSAASLRSEMSRTARIRSSAPRQASGRRSSSTSRLSPSARSSRHSTGGASGAIERRAEIDLDEQVGEPLGRVADAVEAGEPQEAAVGVDDPLAVDHHQPLDRGVGEGAEPPRLLDRVAWRACGRTGPSGSRWRG